MSPELPLTHQQISIVSLGNSIQSYFSLAGTREVYAGAAPTPTKPIATSPVTELSARTFGTWTALSSIIRLYAAYHIHEAAVYELAIWTFGLAFAHFVSEWLLFGTARLGRGLAGPLVVSTVSCSWMLVQWGSYVG
ncbi:hypothetical protein LTR08_004823 [Meristemomyces frigidus]|nr:hypothetical protein LTR08_004823 [Meristemomyces frigidus]